jgi:hypothetical protein
MAFCRRSSAFSKGLKIKISHCSHYKFLFVGPLPAGVSNRVVTDWEIGALEPQAKKFKVFDGDGLYLLVHPKGRDRRAHARQQLAQGMNPRLEKKRFRSAQSIIFSGIADEWVQMVSAPQGELGLNRSGGSSDPEDEHGADDTQDEPNGKCALSPAT